MLLARPVAIAPASTFGGTAHRNAAACRPKTQPWPAADRHLPARIAAWPRERRLGVAARADTRRWTGRGRTPVAKRCPPARIAAWPRERRLGGAGRAA